MNKKSMSFTERNQLTTTYPPNKMLRNLLNGGKQQLRNLWTRPIATPHKPQPTTTKLNPIVWIDCEMTGLNHESDHIIEIACIVTDGNLNNLDNGPDSRNCYENVIHYDKSTMDSMNEWCVEHHGGSGLTQKVLDSKNTREQVELELLNYIKKYIPEKNVGVLAGNSVHMDRLFMLREFPKIIDHLFYRIIDVSSIFEISKRHNPSLASVFPKKVTAHTAKSDIEESIAQLKWYQDHYLKNATETHKFVKQREAQMEQLLKKDKEKSLLDTIENINKDKTEKTTLKRKLSDESMNESNKLQKK